MNKIFKYSKRGNMQGFNIFGFVFILQGRKVTYLGRMGV